MARLLTLLVLLAPSARADHEATPPEHRLVESLRRQLMRDNYDYMEGGESREHHPSPSVVPPPPATRAARRQLDHVSGEQIPLREQDLLYYADAGRLADPALLADFHTERPYRRMDTQETTKVRYKILKMPAARGGRRSMGERRFVQEEGPEGVVIANVGDDLPFPEFRLPPERRQFMGNALLTSDERGLLTSADRERRAPLPLPDPRDEYYGDRLLDEEYPGAPPVWPAAPYRRAGRLPRPPYLPLDNPDAPPPPDLPPYLPPRRRYSKQLPDNVLYLSD